LFVSDKLSKKYEMYLTNTQVEVAISRVGVYDAPPCIPEVVDLLIKALEERNELLKVQCF
jgi:hypothetical protein